MDDLYIERINRGERIPLGTFVGSYWRRLRTIARSYRYDILWIEKEIFPYLPPFVEWALHRLKIPYVVDYDDATYFQYAEHRRFIVRALLKNKIGRVMKFAQVVIVGNGYLGGIAKSMGARNIVSLPSVIDLDRYPRRESGIKRPLTIGWIGSPPTAKYLQEIAGVLNEIQEKNKVRLVLIGLNGDQVKEIKGTRYPWTEANEVALLDMMDIGIMPLKSGPWEKGKCGYKLIQYMACGKPVVASPVGINCEIVKDGVNGFLASDQDRWIQALRLLCDDNDLRRAMGEAGRKIVEDMYSVQVTSPRLINVFRSLDDSISI
jgi:glycosyltransferase involved in cell wall biosynthesis